MENYEIVRPIGKGSFGKVYLVKHKTERKQYCMKTIKLEGVPMNERQACETEVKLLEVMQHPNIVGFKESFTARSGRLLCIVMTYCDGGDLAGRLKHVAAGKRVFKESQILHWFVQLALGLHFMHEMTEKCVLHRDLKTQNIFLLGNGRLVIGDLGISKVLDQSTDFTKTTIGTPYYMSPEVYKSRPYNHKSDVWALGCVLYEMASLRHAFNANSLNGLMGKVVKGRYEPIPSAFSQNLHKLVDRMLSLDPDARPSLPEVLSLPFVKRHVYLFLRGVAQRPTTQIGDGTMVLREAAMGVGSGAADGMLEMQTRNLKRQLESLGMQDLVQNAFAGVVVPSMPAPSPVAPKRSSAARPAALGVVDENLAGHVNRARARENAQPQHRSALRRAAREHRSALVLERERKRAVERALEKLRKERLARADDRRRRLERQQDREDRVRRRQEEMRREDEERRQELIRKQRRADERIRAQVADRHKEVALHRLKSHHPRLVAQRKARQFERDYHDQHHAPSKRMASPPPPPPPPGPPPPPSSFAQGGEGAVDHGKSPSSSPEEGNRRDAVLARRQERRLASERAQKEALMRAAHERMLELKRANALHHQQFHDVVSADEELPKPAAEAQARQEGEEDQNSDEGEQEDLVGGDSASDSDESELEHEMEVLDSDDDDLDIKEVELRQELEAATMRCSSIKKTLQDFRAQVADQEDESDEDDVEEDDGDDNDGDDESEEEGVEVNQNAVAETRRLPAHLHVEAQRAPSHAAAKPSNVAYGEFEASGSESDESSSDDGLFSPVVERAEGGDGYASGAGRTGGGLKVRVRNLQEECVRALGQRRFDKVYNILKAHLETKLHHPEHNLVQSERRVQEKVSALLAGDGKLAYWNKIDNLIFMQEAL